MSAVLELEEVAAVEDPGFAEPISAVEFAPNGAAAEAVFDALPVAERRRLVMLDILAQLDAETLVARPGAFLLMPLGAPLANQDLGLTCYVCMVGAVFVADFRRHQRRFEFRDFHLHAIGLGLNAWNLDNDFEYRCAGRGVVSPEQVMRGLVRDVLAGNPRYVINPGGTLLP